MARPLVDALRKYPLPGWDLDCDLGKFTADGVGLAVEAFSSSEGAAEARVGVYFS